MDRRRAWWWQRQGLDTQALGAPIEVASRVGWLRSVGSANPYLAIHSRNGAGRTEIERSVAEGALFEVPAARGCTYYVPREDAALALRLAAMGTCNAEFKMAERHLGVTDAEVRNLADAIERALEREPLDPRAISREVGPRHLREEGKKRGMTSTLTLGLSRLQLDGRIHRLPQGGRLDTERFRYARWEDGPRPHQSDDETLAHDLADRYYRWAGPAAEREFREFSGLSARLAKLATADLVPCPDDPSSLVRPDDLDAYERAKPTEGRAVLLASLDPWLHLRRNLPSLLDSGDQDRTIPFGKSLRDATSLREMDSHPIAMDGVVVGMWEFDHAAKTIAAWVWRPCEAVRKAIEDTECWIAQELGDFRSFSLDSPKSRLPRIKVLRTLNG